MLKMRSLLFLILLSSLCNLSIGCVTPVAAPMLNSERIKQKFGSYDIQTIGNSQASTRLSNLYSDEHGTKVCRTFAITIFERPMGAPLQEGHHLVVNGQSIGMVFKNLGWALSKENLYIGTIEPNKCVLKFMHAHTSQPLALHVYHLFLSKGEYVKLPYAVIAEIHHPDYLSLPEVHQIYGNADSGFNFTQAWSDIESALKNLSC